MAKKSISNSIVLITHPQSSSHNDTPFPLFLYEDKMIYYCLLHNWNIHKQLELCSKNVLGLMLLNKSTIKD